MPTVAQLVGVSRARMVTGFLGSKYKSYSVLSSLAVEPHARCHCFPEAPASFAPGWCEWEDQGKARMRMASLDTPHHL